MSHTRSLQQQKFEELQKRHTELGIAYDVVIDDIRVLQMQYLNLENNFELLSSVKMQKIIAGVIKELYAKPRTKKR